MTATPEQLREAARRALALALALEELRAELAARPPAPEPDWQRADEDKEIADLVRRHWDGG